MAKIIGMYIYTVDCCNCGRRIEFEKNEIQSNEKQVGMNEFYKEYWAICPHCKNKINMKDVKGEFRE